jgi:type VI secretion system FHA domain protein
VTLTLELIEPSAPAPSATHVFGEEGGTIGRAPTNSWVLPHNKVSGLHARITCRNGVFYVEDTSRNGISVNAPENRLVRNRPYALKTGDRLFIEPYEIGAWIGADAPAVQARADDPFADDNPFFAQAPSAPEPLRSAPILPDPPVLGEVDPLKFFDPVGGPPARKRPELPVDDGLGQHYQPPAIVPDPLPPQAPASPPVIPAGYNPLADDPFVEPIAPPPASPVLRPRPGDSAILRRRQKDSSAGEPRRSERATPTPPPSTPVAAKANKAPELPLEREPVLPQAVRQEPVLPSPKPPSAAVSEPPVMAGSSADSSPPLAIFDGVPEIAAAPPPNAAAAPPPVSAARRPVIKPATSGPPPADVAPAPPVGGGADVSPAAGAGSDLAALLAGAGVPGALVTPELTRQLGEILRVVVAGLMDVLQSRQRIKEEFRMQQTIFRPADNNPLKFSINVEDALHNLLVKRNPAYLGPVDAFADAFDDLRDHQLAMLAGMRVAFQAMLGEFDPDTLQKQFDGQLGKSSLALVPAKMRYWDLYRARRSEVAKDPEEAFERLFGAEFRRAYEEQFRQLKAQRRSRAASDAGRPDRS